MPMEPVWLQCNHCAQPHQHGSGTALTTAAQTPRDQASEPDTAAQATPVSEQAASVTRTRETTLQSVSSCRHGLGWTISLIIDWTQCHLWRRQPTG
jgi:hypothetical protein